MVNIDWRAATRFLPDLVGLASLGLIVFGVWGLAGLHWAAIVAGSPFATFYLWGEAREIRPPGAPDA